MDGISLALGIGGFVAVMIAWGAYLATIPRGKVPRRPVGTVALQLAGVGLAIAGVIWSARAGGSPTVAPIVLAALAVTMAGLFLFLLSQRKTPLGSLQVAVGDALPPFAARDSEGSPFHSSALAGKRVLLKFFRGGW